MLAALAPFRAGAHVAATPAAAPTEPRGRDVKLQPVATGLDSPVAIAWRAARTRPHVRRAAGRHDRDRRHQRPRRPAPCCSFNVSTGSEQGLLGIVFSNDGKKLYVDYTDPTGDIHIVEYTMKGNVANVATRRQLLMIPHHTFPNHNGGNLVIGPDNMLYIGVGDGGGGGDTLHNGQNTDSLLGKILRIDPEPQRRRAVHDPARQPVRRTGRASAARSGCTGCATRGASRSTADARHVDRRRRPGPLRRGRLRHGRRDGHQLGLEPARGFPPLQRRREAARRARPDPRALRTPPATARSSAATCTAARRSRLQRRLRVRRRVHRRAARGRAERRQGHAAPRPAPQRRQLTSFGEGPSGGLYAVSRNGTIYSLVQGCAG